MAKTIVRRASSNKGLDLSSNDVTRDPDYATIAKNVQFNRKTGALEKRQGYQPRIPSRGGNGLFTYNKIDSVTGQITKELLTANNRLHRRLTTTFAITYTGSGEPTVTIRSKSDGTEREILIDDTDGSNLLTFNTGKGFEETTTDTLADAKTAIDAVTDFSATITGTTTLSAALLPTQDASTLCPTSPTLSMNVYEWEEVNRTVSSPFQGSEDNKNNDDYVSISHAEAGGNIYFANGYNETTKYDGQTHYRVGLPQLSRPNLSLTASGGGVAEVTDVVARAEPAVAQVQTITTVADDAIAQITDITIGTAGGLPGKYWILYGWSGSVVESVAIYYGSTEPSHGADRSIQVLLTTGGANGPAIDTSAAIDADSQFSASVSSNIITITDAFPGERPDPEIGTMPGTKWSFNVTTAGTNGLDKTYFILQDAAGSVAFWYDLTGFSLEPAHGADRSLEITGVSFGDTAVDVASATQTVIDGDSEFSAGVVSNVVTVTNVDSLELPAIDAGTTGFTLAVTTKGLDSLDGKYFLMEDSAGSVAIWFDVDDSGTMEPAHGADRSIEVTGVATSDSATAVASAVQSVVDADSAFSASVITATVTITDASVGSRTDGNPGTSDFTITVTTQGTDGGLGAIDDFSYILVAKQIDNAGNIYTGEPTAIPNASITTTAITENVQLIIEGIQAGSGFNTNAAQVDGDQSGVTTITVDSGHTLNEGDKAYFLDRTNFTYTTRNITSTTATTITIDGNDVDVDNGDIISNNLKIQIFRTQAGGTDLFLVEEVPNDSINGSFIFIDGKPDALLGVQFLEQVLPHSLPPKGKYIASFGSQLVLAGDLEAPNVVSLSFIGSDANAQEYWPAAQSLLVESQYGDIITGIKQNNEIFVVFKERSIFTITGDVLSGNIRVEGVTAGETGCVAHHTIQEVGSALMWLDDDGVYMMHGGQLPTEVSVPIRSLFTDDQGFTTGEYNFLKASAFNDRQRNQQYWLYLPVERTAPNGDKVPSSESKILVFNYYRNAWTEWSNINMQSGISKIDDCIFFQERRYSTNTGSVEHVTYEVLNTSSDLDYEDNRAAINFRFGSSWEHANAPEMFKSYIKLKLFNTELSKPSTFSLDVSTEKNYIDDEVHSEYSWDINTVPSTLPSDVLSPSSYVQRLLPGKVRSLRVLYNNSVLYESPTITAWSLSHELYGTPDLLE